MTLKDMVSSSLKVMNVFNLSCNESVQKHPKSIQKSFQSTILFIIRYTNRE